LIFRQEVEGVSFGITVFKEKDMNLRKLMIASVATMGVFRKFAQLSDEEKEEVVNKVKEKLNVKDESPEESEESPEEESPEKTESEDDTTEDVNEPDDEEGSDESESGDEEESDDDEEVDAVPEDESSETEAEPEPETEAEPETESETEEEPEPEPEPDKEDRKDEITDIVNNLVEEVETIKQDGNVAPKDVLGLITNMMKMVNLLVQAKPPTRRRKKSGAEREFLIAEEVAERIAGYSYAVSPLNLELEGWEPFNVDTIRALNREVSFNFKDDEGQAHDDGVFKLIDYKRISPVGPLTYYQEQAMKKRREAPVYLVRGQIPAGSSLTALKALSDVLFRKFRYEVSEAR
jgi:hypothetical protein